MFNPSCLTPFPRGVIRFIDGGALASLLISLFDVPSVTPAARADQLA